MRNNHQFTGLLFGKGKLISFWDMMLKFPLNEFVVLYDGLKFNQEFAREYQCSRKNYAKGRANGEYKRYFFDEVVRQIKSLKKRTKELQLIATHERCSQFLEWLAIDPKPEFIQVELLNITVALRHETRERLFLFITPNQAEYYDRDNLFGDLVCSAFPDAKTDIKEAGNCMAADLHTAAVFHLMRAMEFGLRALAKKLKVRLHRMDITYATWEKVIGETQRKVDALANVPGRRKKKMDELEFYQGILMEYRAMKDVVRNVVSHARCSYDEGQATSVFNHVRGFMQKLAEKMPP